jgi:hypothetical protein
LTALFVVPYTGPEPSTRATWIAASPAAELAPRTSTDSPRASLAADTSASCAVTKEIGVAAACAQEKPAGTGIARR